MRIALLSDVHANLPALEAVLRGIREKSPDKILSLGDQINLGPLPAETLVLLRSEDVVCLSGNHERYVLSVLRGDSAYDGANFESLRFQAQHVTRDEISFPDTLVWEGVTFCHALPGNDRFPVYDPEKALPELTTRYASGFTHIICGHGHNPTQYRLPHLRLDSIGSVGCMDDGVPGVAPYAILDIEPNGTVLRPYLAAYDINPIPGLYLSSGMTDFCPVMAHICCLQETLNKEFLVRFAAGAVALSKSRGEPRVSLQTWQDMDKTFPWPDGEATLAYWKRMRALC